MAAQASFENCVRRVTRSPDDFSVFVIAFTAVVPAMADVLDQYLDMHFHDAVATAHAFHYIIAGLTFMRRLVANPDSDFVLIPMDDQEMAELVARVEAMEWDQYRLQSMLFDYAREYTHPQAWALAIAIIASNRRTKRERRMLAFMLGTAGGSEERPNASLVQDVEPGILRHIVGLSLGD